MRDKIRVILITDGDSVAQSVVEALAHEFDLRCISASAGNPTPISGEEIVSLLKKTPRDPVLVMFDDKGYPAKGDGERALEYVANHEDVEVIGAVAVASNTYDYEGAEVDACIARDGTIGDRPVDKNGKEIASFSSNHKPVIKGDTVDILNDVDVPVVIGIGDIGKMRHKDAIDRGAPITRRAILEILHRNHILG